VKVVTTTNNEAAVMPDRQSRKMTSQIRLYGLL